MPIAAHLLGPPLMIRDGVVYAPPKGKKVWALFGYLVLSDRPPSRSQLIELLFPDAEDPAGALRWNLSELRRLLGGPRPWGAPARCSSDSPRARRSTSTCSWRGRPWKRSSSPVSAPSSSKAWTSRPAPVSPPGCSVSADGSRRSPDRHLLELLEPDGPTVLDDLLGKVGQP